MKNSITHPMKIAEIDIGGRKLGLSFCPGKFQPNALSGSWNRSLDLDIARIKSHGYDVVVSLLEEWEFKELRVTELLEGITDNYELKWISVPIKDGGVPDREESFSELNKIIDILAANKSIFVHCKGGLGRAGTVVAWALTHYGRTSDEAITEVRDVRNGAIENNLQEYWINNNSGLRIV